MSGRRVAIVAGGSTPFVKAGKTFKELGPLRLACHAVSPKTAKLPKSWLGVFFGGVRELNHEWRNKEELPRKPVGMLVASTGR